MNGGTVLDEQIQFLARSFADGNPEAVIVF